MPTSTQSEQEYGQRKASWWREKMMWLVVGGPSVVVVASFITLALALKFPDPVIEKSDRLSADSVTEQSAAMQPAVKARNHAATGGQ
ncbi:hypothetical protein RQP53_07820 [Paucibacter sp. APW11]|uniref:Nitrogen fixation protein FixH n=1 Tax=Roseateles aquae TaxID=3077235 RepID=A0ABU3PA74_9BURK|nr:hypothetical protein [Paucibacter sp. APW11]MDT8999172.1 hypothetical protein [Paucibacter sp. APW11]